MDLELDEIWSLLDYLEAMVDDRFHNPKHPLCRAMRKLEAARDEATRNQLLDRHKAMPL